MSNPFRCEIVNVVHFKSTIGGTVGISSKYNNVFGYPYNRNL